MRVVDGVLKDVNDSDIENGRFEFPDGVTAIGEKAFDICRNLTSITIPENVTFIGENAFRLCTALESIIIPKNVTFIGYSAFYPCFKLASIIMSEGVVELKKNGKSLSAPQINTDTLEKYEKILYLLPTDMRIEIEDNYDEFIKQARNLMAIRNQDKDLIKHSAMQNTLINLKFIKLSKQYGIPSFMINRVSQQFGLTPEETATKAVRPLFGRMNFFPKKLYANDKDVSMCTKKLDTLKSNIENQILPSLEEANECLASLLLVQEKISSNRTAFIENGIDLDFEKGLEDSIKKLKKMIVITKEIDNISREVVRINHGAYEYETITKSYGFKERCEAQKCLITSWNIGEQIIYPLIYEYGFRATITTPIKADSDPVEIEINFLGTVDFASKLVDLDEGGPGQVAIKQHEAKLLEQVNHVIEQMARKYPDKTFRLRISGHSLGGALAKGFAHTMQRACAVLQEEPDKIIDKIQTKWKKNIHNPVIKTDDLRAQLVADKATFNNFQALNKISGITVYALGAPGVSEATDKQGTMLTYYHHPDFLRMYHHHHKDDIMVKFGDTEFLSGKNGMPRVLVNKAITYDIKITPEDEAKAGTLPFPNVTKHVMAAHNKQILNAEVESVEIKELEHSEEILNKFVFLPIERLIYDVIFLFAKFAAAYESIVELFPSLRSLPVYNVDKPAIP